MLSKKHLKQLVTWSIIGLLGVALILWWALQSSVDRSLMTQMPCAPPCWQGIVPGQTTLEEAMKSLQSCKYVAFHDVHLRSVRLTATDTSELQIAQWEGMKDFVARLLGAPQAINLAIFRDRMVECIHTGLDYSVRLEDFVNRYGEPETLNLQGGIAKGGYTTVALFYPEQGLAVMVQVKMHRQEQEYTATLERDSLVKSVLYFAPSSMDELLQHPGIQLGIWRIGATRDALQSWEGFGQVVFRANR